jgi:crotonobetainyl-CoA:carnitine CoA-transferase CaiB-like acyl-CoA transferase
MTDKNTLPLAGVRVLDFGQYVAGPMAATLLADAGAEVIRVETPGGPRYSDPGNAYLLRDRAATHVLDLKTPEGKAQALSLVDKADILIENFRPGVMARLGLDADTCHKRNRGLIYCSLPGFSEQDERAALAGWEGVVMAAGGGYCSNISTAIWTGTVGEMPPFSSLPLASCFAASLAALSASAALIARERDGGAGQRIEIPLSDALLEGSGILMTQIEKPGPGLGPGFAPAVYRARDNRVLMLSIAVYRHLPMLAKAAGRQDLIDNGFLSWERYQSDPNFTAEIRQFLIDLFATRDGDDWVALLHPAGIPVDLVRTTREWLRTPAAETSGCVVEQTEADGRKVRTLGPAVDFQPATPMARAAGFEGRRNAPPLEGVKVLDLARVVAAPTVARLLADLGAEVIKVDADPATARAAYHEPIFHVYLNRGKKGVILNLKYPADRARFDKLTREADVVATNISAGRLPDIALRPEDLRKVNPGLIFTYLNFAGAWGPWAEYRGYAEVANAATGLSALNAGWATAPSGGPPINSPPWPYTDSMAGVLAAFGTVAALYDRGRRGNTYQVNGSLTRSALLEQMPFAVDAADIDPQRGRNISAPGYRMYDAKDKQVFVAIHPDNFDEAIKRLGGKPGEDVEKLLERSIAALTGAECVRLLSFDRSSAYGNEQPSTTMEPDSPWAARGLRVETASEDFGTVVTQAPVTRFSRTPLTAGPTPRIFGKDHVDGFTGQ